MTADVRSEPDLTRTVTRDHSAGLDLTTIQSRDLRELHLSVRPLPGESPAHTIGRLADVLRGAAAAVVRMEIFGSLAVREEVLRTGQRLFGPLDWPVTFIEGASCGVAPLAGLHVLAVAGTPVETLRLQGRPVGRSYSDPWARYLLLGDILPNDTSLPKPDQARQAFENLEAALHAAGLGMPHLARTWLFLDDILSWYGPLNQVRTQFFRERKVFEGLVPGSTGVSGRNAAGAAVAAGAWAAEPLNGTFSMQAAASPRQCPAPEYGSSFSRAVQVDTPAVRRLLVSGTASIAPDGQSVCPGDVEAQIDLTMEVVRAILVAQGLDFPEASRVTAYFKRPTDVQFFEVWRAKFELQDWPVVCTVADICRDELLFEIELDALAPTPTAQ